MPKTKTGECYYRDGDGALWLSESFCDDDGVVSTEETKIEPVGDGESKLTIISNTSEQIS